MKRPTPEELLAADGVVIPDLVRPGLRLLLVGINPGRHSGATGFHFGNPQNLLWRALHQSGLTPRLLRPNETDELLALGIGITNFVNRTTQGSNDLRAADYRAGAIELRAKVASLRPWAVAILTVSGYRTGFGLPHAAIGHQPEPLEGSDLWVFPNPSPINTRYSLSFLVERLTELREFVAPTRQASKMGPRRRVAGAAQGVSRFESGGIPHEPSTRSHRRTRHRRP